MTTTKVYGGYIYRGFFIERAAAGQWNIYPESEAGKVVPDYEKVMDEGQPSLRAAKLAIDAEVGA